MTAHPFPLISDRPAAKALLSLLVLASALLVPTMAWSADPSPKVKAALDLLDRNPTPKAFLEAVRKAGLTRVEAQELEKLMQTPRYEAAYRALRTKAEAENHGPAVPPPTTRGVDLQALRQSIRQEHATRLASLQARAQSGLQQPPARMASPPRRLDPTMTTRMATFSRVRAATNSSPVRLTGTQPDQAITGVVLVIQGRDLGRQGEVTIIVGAEDPRPENAFDCRIIGWGSEAIHVMVPEAIEDMHRARPFPNGRRSALVWVKPEGDLSGRWRPITVTLNPDHFEPVIESVSPPEMTPGLRFAIRGRNLTAGAEPQVKLSQSLTGMWGTLRSLGYNAEWIEVLVPEGWDRFRAGRAGLTVNNGLATSASFAVDFVPVEEVVEFRSDTLDACSWGLFSILVGAIDCPSQGIYGVEERLRAFERLTHEGRTFTGLANDWQVAGLTARELYRDGRGAGCYFEHAPAVGATEFADTVLVGWANSFNGIRCQATLTIRGPRGVPMSR
ncbi:MAG: hypothetical protein AB1625_03385 [Acidobacteriota bacterium]